MEERGWSQFDLHLESGLAKGTIENCTRGNPRQCFARTLKVLADTFGVELTEIQADRSRPPAPSPATSNDGDPGKPISPFPTCKGRLLPITRGVQFIGRDAAMQRLSTAWSDPREHVLSIVAIGGQGKSALIKRWLRDHETSIANTAGLLIWSFDGQGVEGADAGSGSDAFLASAWTCLFGSRARPKDGHRCAAQIAEHLARSPFLLVLDGIEVLQTESIPTQGSARFPSTEPVTTLLRHLAEDNAGLCLITSRYSLADFEEYRDSSVPELRLAPFDRSEARALLQALGITLHDRDGDRLGELLWGHPLSLNLLGNYLAAGGGPSPSGSRLEDYLSEANDAAGDPCATLVGTYDSWLGKGPERDLLRLLSLFDAPADLALLSALAQPPTIAGLNDSLTAAPERKRILALNRLRQLGLVDVVALGDTTRFILHPVVRSHLRTQLLAELPQGRREGHARIYRWMLDHAALEPVSFDDLEPLYQALCHGLSAGLHGPVFDDLVWKRLLQGYPAMALQKFNVGQRDLAALSGFFAGSPPDPDQPRIPSDDPDRLGRLSWWAGLVLLLHGRFVDAIRFFDAAEQAFSRADDQLSVPMAQLYKRTCLLYNGQVTAALSVSQAAIEQLGSVECDISRWARSSTGYVMGTLARIILQIGYRGGKTVPLHLRIGLFNHAEVLHAARRLDDAKAAFESALMSPLPASAREWDMFLIQDSWYLDFLLSTSAHDQARRYIDEQLNSYQDSRLAESIAAITQARLRIGQIDHPAELRSLTEALEAQAEVFDLRTRPQLIHALLELATRARTLQDLELAESLLARARSECRQSNNQLLMLDCLLEEGWIKLCRGEMHRAIQAQMQADEQSTQTGYLLHSEQILALGAAIDREGATRQPFAVGDHESP